VPFHGEEIVSVKSMRQMFVMLTNRAIYYIPKAKPELKKFYVFSQVTKNAFMFGVKGKVFVIQLIKNSVMKIYTTINNLNLTYLFKISLKKYKKFKFFENEKILLLWNKKKIYVLDLKKILLKQKGGYLGFKLDDPIQRITSLETMRWGFKFFFLTKKGIFKSVK
jgi:hypothetical protein